MSVSREDERDFATAAETRRRAGDAEGARALAQSALDEAPQDLRGRIALALALLDLGDERAAHEALARALDGAGAPFEGDFAEFEDDEIDGAFAEAETNPDEMMSANRVVEQTLDAQELDAPDAPEAGFDVSHHPSFATRTMADLLERQGRAAEATALRVALGDPSSRPNHDPMEDSGFGVADAERLRIVSTLESWLYNIQRATTGHERDRA